MADLSRVIGLALPSRRDLDFIDIGESGYVVWSSEAEWRSGPFHSGLIEEDCEFRRLTGCTKDAVSL
jgi:hypothetical protein